MEEETYKYTLILNPNNENREYRCDLCFKYLSIAPIFFNDRFGNICGRCYGKGHFDKRNKENVFHAQKVYESIANYVIFPCSYHNNGCKKQLRWNEVGNHEEICEYRSIICPLSCSKFNSKYEYNLEDACEWKGNNPDLEYHIKSSHSDCISNELEMHFSEDLISEGFNKILFFEVNGVFTVAVMYYFKDFERYYCNVLLDRSFEDCESYHYDVEISDLNKKKCLILPGNKVEPLLDRDLTLKMITGLEVELKVINELLKSPGNMKLSFNVIKDSEVNIKSSSKAVNRRSNYETSIIPNLKCYCGNNLYSPVNICTNGHNCCHLCKYNGLCQVCKSGFIRNTNTTLENLTSLTKYPCKNKARGCNHSSDYSSLEKHEWNCNLTEKNCVMNCDWKGTSEEMREHIRSSHSILQLKQENTFEQHYKSKSYPILFDHKIFLFTVEYTINSPLIISMQCLGIDKWDYEFEFTMLSSSNSINLISTHICQPFIYKEDGTFDPPSRKIEYPFNFYCQFLTEFHTFKFKLNISKVQN